MLLTGQGMIKLKNWGCKSNDLFAGNTKPHRGSFLHLVVPENLGLSLDTRSGYPARAGHVPAGFPALGVVLSDCVLPARTDVNHMLGATRE